MEKNKIKNISEPTNGAKTAISYSEPYVVEVELEGSSDLLFHRWNCESISEKTKAAKNSKSKKIDDLETYVWRNSEGEICLPGEYLRMSIITAAKFKQDPRSPRKSAMDLFKAGIVNLTDLSSLGSKDWDYEDKRRVTIQRAGISRIRPAMKKGWKARFQFQILLPEYIDTSLLQEVINNAGRLVGLADFRPTFGRFNLTSFKVLN